MDKETTSTKTEDLYPGGIDVTQTNRKTEMNSVTCTMHNMLHILEEKQENQDELEINIDDTETRTEDLYPNGKL